jgi:hypothetical protein
MNFNNQLNFDPNLNQNQMMMMPPFMNNNQMMMNNNQLMMNNMNMNNNFPQMYCPPPFSGIGQGYYPQQQMPFPYPYPYPPNMTNPNLPNPYPYYFNDEGMSPFNQQPPPIMAQKEQIPKNKKITKKINNKPKPIKNSQIINKSSKKNNIIINNKNPNDKEKEKEKEKSKNQEKKEKNKDKNKDKKEVKTEKESENQKNITYDSSELFAEDSKSTHTKSLLNNDSHTEKTEKTNPKVKKIDISNKVGYLTQLKKEKEREIKKLEEKELNQKKRLSKSKKIVITSKDKKVNKYENPSEIKLGKIYTTLGQEPKKVKPKAKSVQKAIINIDKNQINNDQFTNKDNNTNNPELDLENLFQKKLQFDSQIKEIKEFLKK